MKVLWTRTPGSEEILFFEELKSLYPSAEFKLAETIEQELKVGDEVEMNLLFIDHDKKRIVYKLEMNHKQEHNHI